MLTGASELRLWDSMALPERDCRRVTLPLVPRVALASAVTATRTRGGLASLQAHSREISAPMWLPGISGQAWHLVAWRLI